MQDKTRIIGGKQDVTASTKNNIFLDFSLSNAVTDISQILFCTEFKKLTAIHINTKSIMIQKTIIALLFHLSYVSNFTRSHLSRTFLNVNSIYKPLAMPRLTNMFLLLSLYFCL